MAPLPDPADLSPLAAGLIAFVGGLGCPAGIERSCKLGPAGIDSGRFLLSFAADARTVPATIRFIERTGLSPDGKADFAEAAATASFLHLGYEAAGEVPRLKVYCEGAVSGAGPLYSAWKWAPAGSAPPAVDDYRLVGEGAGSLVAAALGTGSPLIAPCLALHDRSLREGGEPILLAVRRRGAARQSFDLRLYGAAWNIAAAAPLLAAAEQAFALDRMADRVTGLAGGAVLGHVSGGRDDRDAGFVTVYFGARDF